MTHSDYLGNGLIGIRVGRDGSIYPPTLDVDQIRSGPEEKIDCDLTLPTVQWSGDPTVVPHREQESFYKRGLDMRTGVLTTRRLVLISGQWVHEMCETVVHPTRRIVAQRWTFESDQTANLFGELVKYDHDPEPKRPADDRYSFGEGAWSVQLGAAPPTGVSWAAGADRYTCAAKIEAGSPLAIELVFSCGVNPRATPDGFDDIARAARTEWSKRWQTDIEIDGPSEDQQAVRSFLYFLRSSMNPKSKMPIGPFGLTSGKYNGHVFWDADIWVFPALALLDPDLARTIPDYRLAHAGGAEENYQTWLKAGRPLAYGHAMGGVGEPTGGRAAAPTAQRPTPNAPSLPKGLKFPWESGVSGHETMPGPSRFEDHITGDVLWGLDQAEALGLADPKAVSKVEGGAAQFWRSRIVERQGGKHESHESHLTHSPVFDIPWTMSPDENHNGDNDLYTNLLAQWTLNGRTWNMKPGGPVIQLPRDDKTLLNYDNDPLMSYQQAAALLSVYPLQYPEAQAQARAMLARFAPKITPYGPAMSDSLIALIQARTGDPDAGYKTWRKSWQDFTKTPMLMFAERRTNGETYFTTGAAGCLQTVMYGFLGFRIDSKKDPAAAWSKRLVGDRWLSIKPNLPSAWKSVKVKNFTVLGHRYTLVATHRDVRVTQGD